MKGSCIKKPVNNTHDVYDTIVRRMTGRAVLADVDFMRFGNP